MAQDKLYLLKVALSDAKGTWRRIEILSHQSLDQLHEAIFTAFDRFEPHLYSFYLTNPGNKSRGRFSQAPEYTSPYAIESDDFFGTKKLYDAAKTKISELQLKPKSKFEYLFDFGDEWLHEVVVEKILDLYPDTDYPRITVKNGESPSQYLDHENYEEYESGSVELTKERQKNRQILLEFANYLAAKKLAPKTIKKHLANIDFFINEYLLYDELVSPQDGIKKINHFLGYWFVRKATWSSVTSMKNNITSLKHFYSHLAATGLVGVAELLAMKREIKESKDEWLAALLEYDDPGILSADLW